MLRLCPPTKNFRYLLLIAACWVQAAAPVAAAEVLSLTATPVRLGDDYSIQVAPGEKKQVQVRVRNSATVGTVKLESKAVDFIVAADGATPVPLEGVTGSDSRWSLAQWLTLAPAQHTLAPSEVGVVNVLIEVPADALPGGRYAMIYHRPLNQAEASGGSGSGISQRVGTLLYVVVEGEVKEEAYISRFDWPTFMENGPVNFSLQLDNQSDVHISAQPVVRVYNLFNQEVARIDTELKNVFPQTEREFQGEWQRVWGFGPYRAVVEAVYGTQGQVARAEAVLWLVPVKLILLALILILILTIAVLAIKKRRSGDGQPPTDTMSDNESQTPQLA